MIINVTYICESDGYKIYDQSKTLIKVVHSESFTIDDEELGEECNIRYNTVTEELIW
jgi:hypothetical protein